MSNLGGNEVARDVHVSIQRTECRIAAMMILTRRADQVGQGRVGTWGE